jgi:hypothetical protein
MVRQLLVRGPVHVLQIAGAQRMGFAVSHESDFQFDVESAIAGCWPGQMREGFGVLGCVWGAGELLQSFHGDDPVADACAETFGVERTLFASLTCHSKIHEDGQIHTKGLISNS